MKTTLILIIFVFLTVQINAQNALAYTENIAELATIELPATSKIINSQPEFPGGNKGLANYLTKNIKYPRNSRTSSSRGKVIVCFKVEKNGAISDVKIVKGVNKILNKEAKRVVANMPSWKPAFKNGNAISTVLKIPIVFFRN
ncbi:MAG: energy transducer TonB [Lutibacter sp.]|uniref:energy transducer TonB n=1 Tax=Lutibacter sp. TaxID=1925666 RepID=UPI00385FE2A4